MILDTNALSAFAEGHPAIRELIADAPGPYLPVIVLGEYRFGLLTARHRERRLTWLEALAKAWTVLDVTNQTTIFYAQIRQNLRDRATAIPANDAWIAALAHQHSLPILSNDQHFDLVPGVQRVGW